MHDMQESEDAGGREEGRTEARLAEESAPRRFMGILVVEGVTLLLASSRPIDAKDLEAIRAAAVPLIDTLLRRQLIHPRVEGETR